MRLDEAAAIERLARALDEQLDSKMPTSRVERMQRNTTKNGKTKAVLVQTKNGGVSVDYGSPAVVEVAYYCASRTL